MALKPGQLKCIQTLDKPIVVAAGAGSGKTFTLTKRIVGALESGYVNDIGQVCAITFTNKAAAELKSRVKSELRACGLLEQSLKADAAWISTIHGMCARILRAHAVELDLDPSFAMADSTQVELFQSQAINEVLDEAKVADSQAVNALFEEYEAQGENAGTTVKRMLESLVGAAASNPRGAAAFSVPDVPVSAVRLLASIVDAYEELVEAAERENASNSRDAWLQATTDALSPAREALETGARLSALQALQLVAPLRCMRNFGSKAFKEYMRESSLAIETCVMELRLAAAAPHLATLVGMAGDALTRFSAKKRAVGVLDNNDLLVLAANALESHPDIAAQYADKFKLVMVDEFQDTDQMQVDMIKRIAGPDASRLCTVGDAQQSIYRFRGADVSVYRRHLATVRGADPDGVIVLPDNFRSHPDVLSLVDRVFARSDMFGGEFMSLQPGRDESQVKTAFKPGESRVVVQHTTNAYSKGAPSSEVVREKARRVACEFARLRDQGHPIGGMAVLLGRMNNSGVYAQALREQGLDCVVSGGSVFNQAPEAKMVQELVHVAVNPHDTEALWNVLAGPMFRVPDSELLALATAYGEGGEPHRRALDRGLQALWQQDAERAASPQLALAARVLHQMQREVGRMPLSRVLKHAVLDSGWVSRLGVGGPEGLASAGNVYKAIRMVEDIESSQTLGPLGTMRAFDQSLELAKEAPGALSATGGDFVRIMTVHASKGLEFPIVAVADLKDGRGDSSKLLVLDDGMGAVRLSLDLGLSLNRIGGSVKSVAPKDAVYPALVEGCEDEDSLMQAVRDAVGALDLRAAMYTHGVVGETEESKRLLYVALTRAREYLVVSLSGKRSSNNPNGTPSGCLESFVQAIGQTDSGFETGSTVYDFGGMAPALVEHVALELVDNDDDDGTGALDAAASGEGVAPRAFMVPAAVPDPEAMLVPYADAHEGIFSYSSVSEASHKGDLLARLAARFALRCDEALAGEPWLEPEAPDAEGFLARQMQDGRVAALGDDDDGSWAYMGANCADADKATDLGTAFHRLAQYAVEARVDAGPLAPPPAERERMLVRTCRLDGRQWSRLDEALNRWFGSDEAAYMAQWPRLRAEVPFMVPIALPDAAGTVFLEGEIDLLAIGEGGARVRVVDYKTGGNPAETRETLEQKHVLQASCYAYSLLLQGAQEVEASFVRVERPRADDPAQPQCMVYRFTSEDKPLLEQAIAEAYLLAH